VALITSAITNLRNLEFQRNKNNASL